MDKDILGSRAAERERLIIEKFEGWFSHTSASLAEALSHHIDVTQFEVYIALQDLIEYGIIYSPETWMSGDGKRVYRMIRDKESKDG